MTPGKYGEVCLDLLQDKWSHQYNLGLITNCIKTLLTCEEPRSSANGLMGRLYTEDKKEYERRKAICKSFDVQK